MKIMSVALGLSTLLCVSCSGIKVQSDYDPNAEFRDYDTYAWLPSEASGETSQLLVERVRSSVNSGLSAKGMQEVDRADADLHIKHLLRIKTKVQVNDPFFADPYQTYEEGSLILDFMDAESGKLVWRGSGQTRLQNLKTPEERTERVRQGVEAILAQYPPDRK